MKLILGVFAIILAVGCAGTVDEKDKVTSEDRLDACATDRNCGNCVFYAGCRAPGLPGGLYTFEDKKKIKNSDDAVVGCVAIIDDGAAAGHVAYVTAVDHDPHQVTIDESNWNGGGCGHRTGSKSDLGIYGYWCP